MTEPVAALIEDFARRLDAADVAFGHGAADARAEAELLVRGYLQGHAWNADAPAALRALLRRRIEARIPAAHLTGFAWFAGRWFEAPPGVMIPRSPLQEAIVQGMRPWCRQSPRQVLDLCCGGGALGIAAALRLPQARVTLVDIDPLAVACARRNIDRFGLAVRVRARVGSLFDGLVPQRFDLILANPPYVPVAELDALPPEYRCEPRQGLAAGSDGLDCWRGILAQLDRWLQPRGLLAGEAGNAAGVLQRAYPALPFVWLELKRAQRLADGGFGVFVLDAGPYGDAANPGCVIGSAAMPARRD